MDIKLLEKLLTTPSVTGNELAIQKMLIEELKDVDDVVYTHHSYNVVHVVNPESKVKVMLLAHIDEIGLIIEQVLDNGICKLTNAGSIKPEMYMGQKVNVVRYKLDGTYSYVPGVIGYTPNYNKGNVEVGDLNLDLGTTSREETLKLVSIGDAVVQQDSYQLLENNLVSSRALDDKIATFICTEVLKRIKKESTNGVYFASTVGEETTKRGAIFSCVDVTPTCAITLDVGSSSDVKYRSSFTRDVKLGGGPMFTISAFGNKILSQMLIDTAIKHHIPYQQVVEISKTWTDFDEVYKLNGGIPSDLISIPLRYMHSSVEVGSLKDVEYIVEVLVQFIKSLDENTSFDPFK